MADRWSRGSWLLLYTAFALLAVGIFRDALRGPFVSDDIGYIVNSPYTSELSTGSVALILDPWGAARLYTANYAPVHLLLTAVERQIFADDVLGYHLVNVLLHSLCAVLLVALLRRSGLPDALALALGLLFLVHPANVEAVAWISQLKTVAALALSLAALLLWPGRPAAATACFALGLLTKASASFVLPMAAAFTWVRRGDRREWVWLGAWGVLFALYAVPEFASFGSGGGQVEVAAFDDPWAHARTIAAVGARYLVMAATSSGVSAFAEPEPSRSWLDPWWLLFLPAGLLLAWRVARAARARSEELAWWVAAAAAFAPVSQVFPFVNPVADRYLYFLLPGLLGGAGFVAVDAGERLRASAGARLPARALSRAALAGVAALAVAFAAHASRRAALWSNETRLHLDAARHYPEGGTAKFLEARRAAQAEDPERAVSLLREASERGIDGFLVVREDPGLAPIRETPAFREFIRELAGRRIERARAVPPTTQPELRMLAFAYLEREEYAEAVDQLERALAAGGPLDDVVRAELETVRALRARAEGDRHREEDS